MYTLVLRKIKVLTLDFIVKYIQKHYAKIVIAFFSSFSPLYTSVLGIDLLPYIINVWNIYLKLWNLKVRHPTVNLNFIFFSVSVAGFCENNFTNFKPVAVTVWTCFGNVGSFLQSFHNC